ncbi:hypothetical protein HKD37_04G011591 [Glycine soja]|nr:hypothetical protein GmHk_04G011704 [Glycine max]
MDSKQCSPSNSGANLGPPGCDGFLSFPAVLDSAEEEVASALGLEFVPFTGDKENLHFWACAISKWLKRDMNML